METTCEPRPTPPETEVISLRFDAPPELEPGYTKSQFGQLSKVYKKVSKENKRFADEFMKMLMEQMRRWR